MINFSKKEDHCMKKKYSLYITMGRLQLTLKQYINVLVHARQNRLSLEICYI